MLRARSEQFSAVSTSVKSEHYGGHEQLGPVFYDVPDDTGHWGLRYFEHTLNPLRHAPPGYVLEITTGDFNEDRVISNLPDNVAGIVVVRVPQYE
ncbi:hypothetical protein [Nocardia asiatica]|uniref:hypothetical protein n=1 Tax=Nocardia asiatica TaxID=209252 RepID=UPI000312D79D|nr:hypothetical protein [Nocardia asiatica]